MQVPVSGRGAALAGVSMFMACRPTVVAAHHLGWLSVAIFGPHFLPGRRRALAPPVKAEIWETLSDGWRNEIGAFDEVAILSRRHISRPAIQALLLHQGKPIAFVKGRLDTAALERERRSLLAIEADGSAPFSACTVLGQGEARGWHWLALSPLPVRPHRPERRPALESIFEYIRVTVGGALPPEGVPADWFPMHGDMTPWNLRRLGRDTWLLDWEDAAWGPADADRVYWTVAAAAIRGRTARVPESEASRFWGEHIRARLHNQIDAPLNRRMLAALGGLATPTLDGER